jgi:hypothetical protein
MIYNDFNNFCSVDADGRIVQGIDCIIEWQTIKVLGCGKWRWHWINLCA